MHYTIKAPAKINLGLDVIRRKHNGYHELKMIMQTIALFDTLTFNVTSGDDVSLICSNPHLPTDRNNLVIKAVEMLISEFNIHKHISIHLEKCIPVAAGLAGGSTDAAATLIAMNNILSLKLSKEELMERAVKLGADVPYCIMQGTALAEGIGDILTPLKPLGGNIVLLVKPPIEVSTQYVYSNLSLTPDMSHPDIDRIVKIMGNYDLPQWTGLLENVLESVTIPAYPIIKDIKCTMKKHGAIVSLMSGSGPSVFGIFDNYTYAANALKACNLLSDNMFGTITKFYTP